MIPEQLKIYKLIKLGKWNDYKNEKHEIKQFYPKTKQEVKDIEKETGFISQAKLPQEKGWRETKNYSYEYISEWKLNNQAYNYGVPTGFDNLGVMDDDTPNKRLIKLYEEHFQKTFRIRDHYYIKLLNWDCKKIVFFDETGEHLGELQGMGVQVVGAGSTHPTGEKYEVVDDLPIIEIEFEKFKEVFGKYMKKIKPVEERVHSLTSFSGDDVKEIPISNVISLGALNDVGGSCYQGCHPLHGSENGMNFRVDTTNNIWHCFRCQSGGGVPSLIAVMEGIISCSDAGSNCLRNEKGQKVIKIAREKYGLKSPEENLENLQPMGWAKSLNIKSIAEKYNMKRCPDCLEMFQFEERLGWFRCGCHKWLGIPKFMKLCLSRRVAQ